MFQAHLSDDSPPHSIFRWGLTAQVQALERLGVTPDRILGEFDFSDEKLQDATGVLPPKKQAKIIPENWEPPNR